MTTDVSPFGSQLLSSPPWSWLFWTGSDQQCQITVKKYVISASIKVPSFSMHLHLLHIRKLYGCCWWKLAMGVDEPLVKRFAIQGQTGTSNLWHCSETRSRNLQGCSKILSGASTCYWHPLTKVGLLPGLQCRLCHSKGTPLLLSASHCQYNKYMLWEFVSGNVLLWS